MAESTNVLSKQNTDELTGHLWICSSYERVITISNQNVSSLAFGRQHCLFLTAKCNVYSFGANQCGQLGIGNLNCQLSEPQIVQELPINVVSITCGPATSAALTLDGLVYMWGDNRHGQCGQQKNEFLTYPRHVNLVPSTENNLNTCVVQIACGANHTLALTALRHVWVWGTQTGSSKVLPSVVNVFAEKCVLSIACGLEHSLAVVLVDSDKDTPKQDSKHSKLAKRLVKISESSISSEQICPLGLPLVSSSPANSNEDSFQTLESDKHNHDVAKEVLCDIIDSVVEIQNSTNQDLLEEKIVIIRHRSLNEGYEDRAVKRTGSFLDAKIAKAFLEKLTDVNQNSVTDVSFDNQESHHTKIPYVWDVVNKVKDSFDRLSISLGRNDGRDQIQGSEGSSESFEVVETNLIEMDMETGVVRSGSLKSLLELKQASRSRCKTASLEILPLAEPDQNEVLKKCSSQKLLQTEVWSWGKGLQGQLGHGNEKDRWEASCIRPLSGQGVTRVLSGGHHSLALTLDGRLFSWGSNSKGQLGHSFRQANVHTPRVLQLPQQELIWDVSAGEEHTLLLVDSKPPRVSLYFCGGHNEEADDEVCVCPNEKGLHQLNILKKSGLVLRVFGGGPRCGCLISAQRGLEGHVTALHQWASSERWFLHQLNILLAKLLVPLLTDGTLTGLLSIHRDPLQEVVQRMSQLADLVALSSHELTLAVLGKTHHSHSRVTAGNSSPLGTTQYPWKVDAPQGSGEWIQAFWGFFQALADVIATSAAAALTKEWSVTPNRLKMLGRDSMGESLSLDLKTSNEILLHLMHLPVRRAKEYLQLINRANVTNNNNMATSTEEVLSKWQKLLDVGSVCLTQAEKTKVFWENSSNKLTEAYRVPGRRLVRESKKYPMSLHPSGLFSSHWFILFNDILVHSQFGSVQWYPLQTTWVEPLPDDDTHQNAFILRMPEEMLTLTCATSAEKTEWVCTLNLSIKQLLDWEKDPLSRLRSGSGGSQRLSPPLPRQASYTFNNKTSPLKEANYTGMWLCGKMHGHGRLEFPDGRSYVGKFKQNLQDGEGTLTVPHGTTSSSEQQKNFIYEGQWKDGKLNGYGSIRYPNGDLYEGFFRDDQRHGHGMLKQGQFTSTSLYVGQWANNVRDGYGVLDSIHAGEKYMGLWSEDQCHGSGVVVTIDGIYYEGPFANGKLQGSGLMLFEDGTRYQGELGANGTLNGKGTLFLSSGDMIDGTFGGIWSEGIKINGHFHKGISSSVPEGDGLIQLSQNLSVEADQKWQPLFGHCRSSLNVIGLASSKEQDNHNAWQAVAIALHKRRKGLCKAHRKRISAQFPEESLDYLEHIPHTGAARGQHLTWEEFQQVALYLARACDCPFHPLGTLVDNIVDVYRASYSGVGAHPCLLKHAVAEAHSFFKRFYLIVRVLFPDLPEEGQHYVVRPNQEDGDDGRLIEMLNGSASSDSDCEDLLADGEVVSGKLLVQQTLMPKLYQPLFTLYALHDEAEDEQYWKRLVKWNRQTDIPLMTFLGVDPQFWLCRDPPPIACSPVRTSRTNFPVADPLGYRNSIQSYSAIKEEYFSSAVEMLQHISSQFSPMDKLKTIHKAFQEISKEVQGQLGAGFLWTMDYLFPVFQYVVVRARICHLGSEIHFIDDLMEKHFEMGELGIMFTTLKACYFQIRTEKLHI